MQFKHKKDSDVLHFYKYPEDKSYTFPTMRSHDVKNKNL
jgi:hypothetical protein